MKFIVAEEIFQKLPNACFGVVMARGLKNDRPQPANIAERRPQPRLPGGRALWHPPP